MDTKKPMTAREYNDALKTLGLSVYASPGVLSISLRQSQRYASGEQVVAQPIANHLNLLLLHVNGLKQARKRLLKQIEAFESGRGHIYQNRVDVTAETLGEVKRQLSVIEDLLTNHPAGLKPQIEN